MISIILKNGIHYCNQGHEQQQYFVDPTKPEDNTSKSITCAECKATVQVSDGFWHCNYCQKDGNKDEYYCNKCAHNRLEIK